jgi:hypothetical protein
MTVRIGFIQTDTQYADTLRILGNFCRLYAVHLNIRSLSVCMVGSRCSAYLLVMFRAAIAGIDIHGLAESVPDLLQDLYKFIVDLAGAAAAGSLAKELRRKEVFGYSFCGSLHICIDHVVHASFLW